MALKVRFVLSFTRKINSLVLTVKGLVECSLGNKNWSSTSKSSDEIPVHELHSSLLRRYLNENPNSIDYVWVEVVLVSFKLVISVPTAALTLWGIFAIVLTVVSECCSNTNIDGKPITSFLVKVSKSDSFT